jgi:hypothetical protein
MKKEDTDPEFERVQSSEGNSSQVTARRGLTNLL